MLAFAVTQEAWRSWLIFQPKSYFHLKKKGKPDSASYIEAAILSSLSCYCTSINNTNFKRIAISYIADTCNGPESIDANFMNFLW